MNADYRCDTPLRKEVTAQTTLNGAAYVEVLDHDAPGGLLRQQTLIVRCLRPLPPRTSPYPIAASITGGPRALPVGVAWVGGAAHGQQLRAEGKIGAAEEAFFGALPSRDRVLLVRTDRPGDFSRYTLTLSNTANAASAPANFDPRLTELDFSFKAECPADFDCDPAPACPPPPPEAMTIDYLAKDYASFRRTMFDRLSVALPQWTERNPADIGVALVELLAYTADQLSYEQDAVATEAYLNTARSRISVRRHARLLDYWMHEGCNARVWLQVLVTTDVPAGLPAGTLVSSNIAGEPQRLPQNSTAIDRADVVFTTLQPLASLYKAHDAMPFYTWSDSECCLPSGATRATLKGPFPGLKKGDALIFEEMIGAKTGDPDDADVTRRQAVRLVKDADVGNDPVTNTAVTTIEWGIDDRLAFPFCVSAVVDGTLRDGISIARGNVVLADHGRAVTVEPWTATSPFRPRIAEGPLTYAAQVRRIAFDENGLVVPASAALRWDMSEVLPEITLDDGGPEAWSPVRDLLGSAPVDRAFVVEADDHGRSFLRFGDDRRGARPLAGTQLTPTYRLGSGTAGNVGREALTHIFTNAAGIAGVRNPMPAGGGVDPETMAEVRRRAPYAFQTQERAVTEADYARMAERHHDVQRAEAAFRWTGSWHTVFVGVDAYSRVPVSTDNISRNVVASLERYRMAGYDLDVTNARVVPLALDMKICVKPDYFRHEVQRALLRVFTSGRQPDGRPGLFHPDNFTFGQPVYLSVFYAAAQAVPGVASVEITRFGRKDSLDTTAIETGVLVPAALELFCLDNDPSFPDRGTFLPEMGGGR